MKIRVKTSAALALLACLSGCALEPRFDVGYTTDAMLPSAPTEATLLALPFEDERPPMERQSMGRIWLPMIPLWPSASVTQTRMDEVILDIAGTQQLRPTSPSIPEETLKREGKSFLHFSRCFPAAIGADLQASGLFAEAEFQREAPDHPRHHYRLTGTLLHSSFRQVATFYGLSVLGAVPMALGAPRGVVSCEVRLKLSIHDAVSGDLVWEEELAQEVSSLLFLYGAQEVVYDGRRTAAYVRMRNNPWGASKYDPNSWRQPFRIPRGDDDEHLDSRSLYWWHFEALRLAMERAKPRVAQALARRPLPDLPPPPKPKAKAKTKKGRMKITGAGPSRARGPGGRRRR